MYIFALIAIIEIITTKLEIAVQKPKGTKSVQTIKKTDENLYDNDNDLEWSFDEYSFGKMKMLVCRFLGNPVELMVSVGTSHLTLQTACLGREGGSRRVSSQCRGRGSGWGPRPVWSFCLVKKAGGSRWC